MEIIFYRLFNSHMDASLIKDLAWMNYQLFLIIKLQGNLHLIILRKLGELLKIAEYSA